MAQKQLKIVAFGNSITARRPTVDSVYADRLPALLKQVGLTCTVINSGVGSSHSGRLQDNDFAKVSHGLDRFNDQVLAHNPTAVIIGFGTNDAYIDGDDPKGPSRIPLKNYRENLIVMITELRKRGIHVVLLAPSPFALPEERMYQNRRLYQYVKAVRRIAKKYRVGLSDNYKLFKDYGKRTGSYANLLPDGVHPNDEGHEMIANNIAREITKILMK